MKKETKIAIIAILAPVLCVIPLIMYAGLEFIAISPVVIVVSFPFSWLAIFFSDKLFGKYKYIRKIGILFGCISGLVGGFMFYCLFFYKQVFKLNLFSYELAADYLFIGFFMGLIASTLYFVGPLKIKPNK